MELVFGSFLWMVVAGATYAYFRRVVRIQERARALRDAAEGAGLGDVSVETPRLGPQARITARLGPLRVVLETSDHGYGWAFLHRDEGERHASTRIVVDGLGWRPSDLAFRLEDLDTTLAKAWGAREVEVGDGAFDEHVYVQGHPAFALAVFDAETRRLVLGLLQDRVEIPESKTRRSLGTRARLSDGRLVVEVVDALDVPTWSLENLRGILAIAGRLARPADVAARLAASARRDPLASVRLACLKALVHDYPGRPATLQALRDALGDVSDGVRLHAAMGLGPEGHETLLAIAADEYALPETSARAIEVLGSGMPRETVSSILARSLRTRRVAVAAACLESLGRLGGPASVESLVKVLSVERGELAVVAARALGETGVADAEESLLEALDRHEPEVRLAAAGALGRVGTAAAVAPLRSAANRHREEAARRAVRQAIGEIHSRLPGATPGQLSLAGQATGRLSLADDARGRLSLSRKEEDEPHDRSPADVESD